MDNTHETIVITLLDVISRCTNSELPWQALLDKLLIFFPSMKIAITSHDSQEKLLNFAIASGFDPDFENRFYNYYHKINPWSEVLQNAPPTPHCLWAHKAFSHEKLIKTEFYQDWVRPQEDIAAGLALGLSKTAHSYTTLNINFNYKYMEEAQKLANVLRDIGAALKRGLEIYRRLQGQNILISSQETILNRIPSAIFILDKKQNILFHNKKAEQLLRAGHIVKTDRSKALYFVSHSDQNAVFPQLSCHRPNKAACQKNVTERYIRLEKPIDTPFIALVSPFKSPEDQQLSPFGTMTPPEHKDMVMIIDPSEERTVNEAAVKTAYLLTPAQTKLAMSLFKGMAFK